LKKLLIVFAVTGLCLLSYSPGEAANWVLAGTSEDGNASLYVDRESIVSSPQNVTSAWTKFLFGNPEPFESKFFSQMSVLIEYDCSGKKLRMLELIFDYTDGNHETFKPEGEWRSVKPGTLENEAYQHLCK
jgi:hypothetical protein